MTTCDMSRLEFNEILKDIGAFFGKPRDPRALDILYGIFKPYPYGQMQKACRWLIEHHDSRSFPSPRDIHDALREVADLKPSAERPADTPEEAGEMLCDVCRGVGMMIEDRKTGEYQHAVAVYCDCGKGRRTRSAHEAYLKRRAERFGGGGAGE